MENNLFVYKAWAWRSSYNAFWNVFGELTEFQTQVSGSALAGCGSWCTWKERLRYISGFNCPQLQHHLAGNHHWRGPRTLAVPKKGQLKLLLHRKSTLQVLWQSIPVLDHLLNKNFASVFVELPAFQCVPTAPFSLPWGTTENGWIHLFTPPPGS